MSVTIAVADLVVSATLVAVMVTVCVDEIVPGAVYKPLLDRVPADGLMLQVTAVLLVPVTVAVNCCWPFAVRVAVDGLTDTATGLRVTVAVADLVVSATLVAVMVTVCVVGMVPGAVYKPLLDSVPANGLMLQVTAVLLVPVTVAVNCCWPFAVRVAVDGLTDTVTGLRVTVAVADLVVSATLVAVMVTVCVVGMVPGAVYKPLLDRVPADGLMLQVTAVLLVPVTVAVNCCWPFAVRVAVDGLTDTATGLRVTVAVADLVVSATLVAVMVTVCAEEIVPGAVYKPLLDSVPADGLMLQVTAVLLVPVTVAVNCCWPFTVRVAVDGLTDTATGLRVTVAVADLVVSATLVAVMVTVCAEEIVPGAVYKPLLDSVPANGLMLQVTAVLLVPVTVAVNCCWPFTVRVDRKS